MVVVLVELGALQCVDDVLLYEGVEPYMCAYLDYVQCLEAVDVYPRDVWAAEEFDYLGGLLYGSFLVACLVVGYGGDLCGEGRLLPDVDGGSRGQPRFLGSSKENACHI